MTTLTGIPAEQFDQIYEALSEVDRPGNTTICRECHVGIAKVNAVEQWMRLNGHKVGRMKYENVKPNKGQQIQIHGSPLYGGSKKKKASNVPTPEQERKVEFWDREEQQEVEFNNREVWDKKPWQ